MKRVFVAVELPNEVKEKISGFTEDLRVRFTDRALRWVANENLHITLHFAGDIDDAGIARLTANTATAAERQERFIATVSKTGSFISRTSRSNPLWIGVTSPDRRLDEMAFEIQRLEGIASPRFTAHITVARVKDPPKARDLVEEFLSIPFPPMEFRIDRLVIYESTLSPRGSTYSVLSTHPLG
jgi:RNA 2',3'-cyclic 3'-phosphodiesterase